MRIKLRIGMNGLIKGKEVHFDDEYLHVKLEDGRIISTPMEWYEPLKEAPREKSTKEKRVRYQISNHICYNNI